MGKNNVKEIVKILCGVMATVNMLNMVIAVKTGNTNDFIVSSVWAIIMTLNWRL